MKQHRARKRFGQHFLTDSSVIDAILRSIHATDTDVIVEIGPGQGAITNALAKSAGHLHAVELDRDLVRRLRQHFGDNDCVTIHEADALSFDFASLGDKLRIVGNLPYNISTPLMFHLLGFRECIVDMHFMLQKEVVDRMVARPGSKAYGRLSIMLGCHLNIESLFTVDATSFDPPPSVQSAIVRLDPLADGTHGIADEGVFAKVVASAFMQRRKTLRNGLRDLASAEDFAVVGIDPGRRAEQLEIADFVALSNHLSKTMG